MSLKSSGKQDAHSGQSIRLILAHNIRDIRKQIGISQEELADSAGLHRTYIGSIERGERNISVDNILKISRALKTSAARLFEGEENAQTP